VVSITVLALLRANEINTLRRLNLLLGLVLADFYTTGPIFPPVARTRWG
jgi:hypothetical protein